MPEGERAPTDRHATWVALRTFHLRPTVVGRTERGETVYEVRAVRLLLPPGSSHFKRLVQCAKCQVDMGGAPVLSPDDLDRQPNPFFCGTCVRPAPPAVEPPPAPAPAEWTAQQVLATVSEPLKQLADRQRALEEKLSEVERRLDALTASVDTGASRQHVIEQKLHQCMEQVGRLEEAQAEEAPEAPPRPPGEILEGLERQLRAAEERLSQR